MNIYVGNFTELMTETTLREIFEPFGVVDHVKIIKDRFSGRSRGYGFVEMPSNSEADKAIKALNGNMIHKKPLKIKHGDSGAKKKRKNLKKKFLSAFFQTGPATLLKRICRDFFVFTEKGGKMIEMKKPRSK